MLKGDITNLYLLSKDKCIGRNLIYKLALDWVTETIPSSSVHFRDAERDFSPRHYCKLPTKHCHIP